MPYHVVKEGRKWAVKKKDNSKTFGTHPTKEAAEKQMAALYANEPKAASRVMLILGGTGPVRTETYEGEEHLVVPVILLVEGVVHAMNAQKPELVRAATFAVSTPGWQGRPVFSGHPVDANGRPVSGNTPYALEHQRIGIVFHPATRNRALAAEAWISPKRCETVGGAAVRTLERLRNNETVEVSTGTFVSTDDSHGRYAGKDYVGEWHNMLPDHLAILPEGHEGACSVDMGCGTHRAAALRVNSTQLRRLMGGSMAGSGKKESASGLLDRLRAAFAPDMSDVDVRTELREALVTKEPALASIVAVYDNADPKYLVYMVYESGEPCLYKRTYTDDGDDAEVDDARVAVEQVISYEPSEPGDSDLDDEEVEMAAASKFFKALVGKSISAENMKKVQSIHDKLHDIHDTAADMGADCPGLKASAAPCGCKGVSMTKKDRVAALIAVQNSGYTSADAGWLEQVPDTRLEALEMQAKAGIRASASKDEAEKVIKDKHSADEALAAHALMLKNKGEKKDEDDKDQKNAEKLKAAKAAGFESVEDHEFYSKHPEIKSLVDAQKTVAVERHAFLVAKLKAASTVLSEDELKKKTVAELETLAKFAQIDMTDFSGRGMPVVTALEGEAAARLNPPDGYAEGLKRRNQRS